MLDDATLYIRVRFVAVMGSVELLRMVTPTEAFKGCPSDDTVAAQVQAKLKTQVPVCCCGVTETVSESVGQLTASYESFLSGGAHAQLLQPAIDAQ
jgi:metal-sulfur cluster biosynthetic enzyme